jgi:hypothetical protein
MRKHRRSISILLFTASLGLSMACSKHPNDDAIAKNIQTKVATDPDTKDSNVSVIAKDGKVTLTGRVKSSAAQQKVEQIAKEEPGASGIDDQIAVASDAMALAPAQLRLPLLHLLRSQNHGHCCACRNRPHYQNGQALGSKLSKTGETFRYLSATSQRRRNRGQYLQERLCVAKSLTPSPKVRSKVRAN